MPIRNDLPAPNRPGTTVISVSELNRRVRDAIEAKLPLLWVGGEISNLTWAASGHGYFTLKDANAQVRCVIFRSRLQLLGFRPQNGDRVEARALASLYEARGDFQLNVDTLRQAGAGNLFEAFLKLKAKLEGEGLFAAERKRPLAAHPRCIGIVTSPQAAALRDVVTTLRRRAPQVALILYPTAVQGDGAPLEIVAALAAANARRECETLILCRGGGSLEDLWSFNDERVARAVAASKIPVITGVGHETDTTIVDFVADLRAPTPSGAAELASPARADLLAELAEHQRRLRRALNRRLENLAQRTDLLARRLRHPGETLARHRGNLALLAARGRHAAFAQMARRHTTLAPLGERFARSRPNLAARQTHIERRGEQLNIAMDNELRRRRHTLNLLDARLAALDPRAVLGRGYAIATDAAGHVLGSIAATEPGTQIRVHLADGRIDAQVTGCERNAEADVESANP
jgi:exodeoxyribonuclease VII large subunit